MFTCFVIFRWHYILVNVKVVIQILLSKACNLTDDLEQAAIRRESLKLSFAVLGLCLLDVPAQHSSIKCLVPLLQVILFIFIS